MKTPITFTACTIQPYAPLLIDSARPNLAQELADLQASLHARGEACIYLLLDPRTIDVKYVGCTTQPVGRWKNQLTGRTSNRFMWDWVQSLKRLGLGPRLWVIDRVAQTYANEREAYWITWAVSRGTCLNVRIPDPLQPRRFL